MDLRAALGRHPGMVLGHPSRSVMTRHPHTARQPLNRACPRDWTPGCSDQPPVKPPSWEAGVAAGVAGARGASRASAGCCPGTHPADLEAWDPPFPALLLLGHTLRAGPRSLLRPPGPTAPHSPTWRAASCLPPGPSSRSARPPGSALPPREGLDPLTPPVCSFRPWGASALPPPPAHSTCSTADRVPSQVASSVACPALQAWGQA